MSPRQPSQPPSLPPRLRASRADASAQVEARITQGQELRERTCQTLDEVKGFIADSRRWSDVNAEILRRLFDTDEEYTRYVGGVALRLGGPLSPREELEQARDQIQWRIEKLKSLVERLPFIELVARPDVAQASARETEAGVHSRAVFVVHGHDDTSREAVARLLTSLDLQPIILNEQPDRTLTIIEKFEQHAATASFAVVLLTPDDSGTSAGAPDNPKPRARQNVVLELGYFLGAWKRTRVCALYKAGVELPSDLHGLLYVELDAAGAWRLRLAQELDAAGIQVDFNRLRARR